MILATGAAGWLLLGLITAAAATTLCPVALRGSETAVAPSSRWSRVSP